MALFRGGVKVAGQDIRAGLGKGRAQDLLRKQGIIEDDKGRKKYEKDARGEVQMIRTAVGQAEGFTFPVNFKVAFNPPQGIEQPVWDSTKRDGSEAKFGDLGIGSTRSPAKGNYGGGNKGEVKGGSLDWKTHKMNYSTTNLIRQKYNEAAKVATTLWNPSSDNMATDGPAGKARRTGDQRSDTTLNLYCSKVTIPEKTINVGQLRQYGPHFPWPQSVSYGTLSTTFYCDGAMKIKTFFDAWQKLIYNDLTGNFNYLDEYKSEFDIFTRSTIASGGSMKAGTSTDKHETQDWATDLSNNIKGFTKKVDEFFGSDGPRDGKQAQSIPAVEFRNNYGVKIFDCFPQMVGSIDLGHANSGIAEFSVTWAYRKWNPFKMGNVGNRSQVNLSVGEFRNEKDGFPFLEDLPGELSGPLTGAVNQGIVTGPLSNASNLFG
jgi:hypothetical protein